MSDFLFPALFLSHGSPMVALETSKTDDYVAALSKLRERFPKPEAILAISAHWYTRGKFVDVSKMPATIYDFFGFPKELYEIEYPCPGFPKMSELLDTEIGKGIVKPVKRGMDHGIWSVLRHLYPEANVPVACLSVDSSASAKEHFDFGKKLAHLRDHGILVIGTGNFVHDLSSIDFSEKRDGIPYPFAREFDDAVKRCIEGGKMESLFRPETLPGGMRSVPTPDHYLPALTILGMAWEHEKTEWIYEGFELGSISRRAFGIGLN